MVNPLPQRARACTSPMGIVTDRCSTCPPPPTSGVRGGTRVGVVIIEHRACGVDALCVAAPLVSSSGVHVARYVAAQRRRRVPDDSD